MPVHRVKGGGYQWGGHGKVYHGKNAAAKAARQGAAAYAHGYTGKPKTPGPNSPVTEEDLRRGYGIPQEG